MNLQSALDDEQNRRDHIPSWQYHSMFETCMTSDFKSNARDAVFLSWNISSACGRPHGSKSFVPNVPNQKCILSAGLNPIDATIFTSKSDQFWNEQCKSAEKWRCISPWISIWFKEKC